MAEKNSKQSETSRRKVINTLTDEVVFTGTFQMCMQMVLSDKSGFLQLAP